jgi:hypothetical protein
MVDPFVIGFVVLKIQPVLWREGLEWHCLYMKG